MCGSTSELILTQIAAGRPALAWTISLLDRVDQMAAQGERRGGDLLQRGGFGIAGDVVEKLRRIAAERRIGAEQRQVGVDPRRVGMIVAGAEMDIGVQLTAFAAHHQADLGVRLELDEAVDHLHAGAFQVARPFDVRRFVEAGLELDQRGDRFARFRRLDQRRDDRAVADGAVERLLDRDDVGIGRGLAHELHHGVETLEGMMDDDVLLADRREAVAAVIADALGKARHIWLELQIAAARRGSACCRSDRPSR